MFMTYIRKDHSGNAHLRMEIIVSEKFTVSSMLSNATKRAPMNMAKDIHCFTHATAAEMAMLLQDSGHSGT